MLARMEQLLATMRAIVGDGNVLEGDDLAGVGTGGMEVGDSHAPALIRPGSTAEVAAVLAACNDARVSVVPLGGGTGLAGATNTTDRQILVSLERLRLIEGVDAVGRTMTVQAGVVLQAAHEAAAAAGLLFPVDLGARGSAQVGGLVATNAGGNGVIRYGMMRENLLGLEVVLADGTVLDSMNAVVKNNTGYDLKHLFCGSEGTLGIVTRAILRLRPAPRSRTTALVAVPTFSALATLLTTLESRLGGSLSAFEAMWNSFYSAIAIESGHHTPPLPAGAPYYALVEAHGGDPVGDEERFTAILAGLAEEGLITDAAMAMSSTDRQRLWDIRDDIPALVAAVDTRLVYDVSVPIPAMDEYVTTITRDLRERLGAERIIVFGHLGDGNLHVAVGGITDDGPAGKKLCDTIVYDALLPFGGSVSAEHGVGEFKKPYLDRSRTAAEVAVMRSIKAALDPNGIMNPGKIF